MSPNRFRIIFTVMVVLGLVGLPLVASNYVVNVVSLIFLHAALASMWNLLAGYSGMVSLGQQMFVGAGGYTMAVLTLYYGFPISLAVLSGGVLSVILALVISVPVFRMKGAYFAIGTWVIAEALAICFSNWGYVRYGMGLFVRSAYQVSMSWVYYAAMLMCMGSVWLVYVLLRSKFGLALMTIREDDVAAEALGVNLFGCKLTCFLISAFVTGTTAGILYLNAIFIQPFEAFGIGWTVKLLFIVIIGGIGTVEGPVVGAILFVLLQQFLAEHVGYNLIILGTVTLGVILIAPRGIVGALQKRFGIERLPVSRL